MKMNKITTALAVAATLTTSTVFADKLGANILSDRFIVHAKAGQFEELQQAMADAGAQVNVKLDDISALSVTVTPELFATLKDHKAIAEIELDAKRFFDINADIVTLGHEEEEDPLAKYGERGETDFIPWGIESVQGLEVSANPANPVTICVVDTGYDLGHEDLPVNNVNGTDQGAGSWYMDGHSHGTHVAGTIAAVEGNGGVVGLIDEASSDLYIARVFNNAGRFVYASSLAGAVSDCAEAGANVVNMSLGGPLHTKAEQRTFEKLRKNGVLMVAAAGNDGVATHSYPASYDSIMSVAAMDRNLDHAYFSQYTTQVEISAPGVNTLSTHPGNRYSGKSGTSMASPHVAGVAAVVWSHYPQCSSYDIRSALKNSAKDIGTEGFDYKTGHGLVQAKDAMDYLAENGCSGNVCKGNECKPD